MPKIIKKTTEAYKTISQASKLIGVPAYVLRFWEKEFQQIKPYKYKNRRHYLQKDIEIIKNIKDLLYNKGHTIEGAKKCLRSRGDNKDNKTSSVLELTTTSSDQVLSKAIKEVLGKLKNIQKQLV
jgi:DNA-binding transcriptional MerR regulator